MPTIQEIIACIENHAPLALQENYDNAGLICGETDRECTGVLLTLDCTEEGIREAQTLQCNLIISHHPLIFRPLKKITGKDYVSKALLLAIRSGITLYAAHTNADNVLHGVNLKIAEKLGLEKIRILSPKKNALKKLVVFVPESHLEAVSEALFQAGAGKIGNYDACSFRASGIGTFRGGENTQPFVGKKNILNKEPEVRMETIFPFFLEGEVIRAMLSVHPYEEPAYDIYPLDNVWAQVGSGIIGEYDRDIPVNEFLSLVAEKMQVPVLRYTSPAKETVRKIALCGGSGSFLIHEARRQNADVFITSDIKYHDFFESGPGMFLIDIGHFEAEKYTPELLGEWIQKKFPNFALRFSKTGTNPVKYFVR